MKKLLHLRFLSVLLLMLCGVTSVWAEDETVVSQTSFTAISASSIGDDSNLSYSTAQNDGTSTIAAISGTLRLYKVSSGKTKGGGITIEITEGYTITSITFTNADNKNCNNCKVNFIVDDQAWGTQQTVAKNTSVTVDNIEASKVEMYVSSTDNAFWINGISVTYKKASSGGQVDPVETVATPTFNPEAGTYPEAKDVTISCETEGATIYYTTNGIDPTTSSTAYTEPIHIEATTTIKAIAAKEGMNKSDIVTAVYTIEESGTSEGGNTVTYNFLNWNFPGAQDWTSSDGYSQHVVEFDNATVTFEKAMKPSNGSSIADCPVTKGSDVTVLLKDMSKCITSFSAIFRQWNTKTQTVTLNTSSDGINFVPTTFVTSEFKFSTIELPEGTKAIKFTFGNINNQIGIESIKVTYEDFVSNIVASPTISVATGKIYEGNSTVQLSCSTEGASIYYTLNGDEPTASSTPYNGTGVEITESCTLKAIAVKEGMDNSEVASATYKFMEVYSTAEVALVGKYTNEENAVEYYAMNQTYDNGKMGATPVQVVNGKVASEDPAIVWKATYYTDGESDLLDVTYQDANNNYLHNKYGDAAFADLSDEPDYWVYDLDNGIIYDQEYEDYSATSGIRIILYSNTSNCFKTYAKSNAGTKDYSIAVDEYSFASFVTVNISAAGYATLYYGENNLTVPTGVTAYTYAH